MSGLTSAEVLVLEALSTPRNRTLAILAATAFVLAGVRPWRTEQQCTRTARLRNDS